MVTSIFMFNEARKTSRGCMTIPWKKYSAFTKTKDKDRSFVFSQQISPVLTDYLLLTIAASNGQ